MSEALIRRGPIEYIHDMSKYISGNKKEYPHAYIPHTHIQDIQQKTRTVWMCVWLLSCTQVYMIYICTTNTAREGGGEGSEDVAQREKYRETCPCRTHSSLPPPTHTTTHTCTCASNGAALKGVPGRVSVLIPAEVNKSRRRVWKNVDRRNTVYPRIAQLCTHRHAAYGSIRQHTPAYVSFRDWENTVYPRIAQFSDTHHNTIYIYTLIRKNMQKYENDMLYIVHIYIYIYIHIHIHIIYDCVALRQ
jgi:hypothetical protein